MSGTIKRYRGIEVSLRKKTVLIGREGSRKGGKKGRAPLKEKHLGCVDREETTISFIQKRKSLKRGGGAGTRKPKNSFLFEKLGR